VRVFFSAFARTVATGMLDGSFCQHQHRATARQT
jgi:hypothetical protein